MQTLRTGRSKVEPKNFHASTDPHPRGVGRPKFNQLEMVTTFTQFGEDRCTQFQVIVVTDPQTNKHSHNPTHRQGQLQYTALLSLARSEAQQTEVHSLQCYYSALLCNTMLSLCCTKIALWQPVIMINHAVSQIHFTAARIPGKPR